MDSGSSARKGVRVQVPSTAGVIEKAGHKACLFYYVAEPNLNPRVQGLLDMNVSSVGSTGKRFTEPFSDSVSPHQLHSVKSRVSAHKRWNSFLHFRVVPTIFPQFSHKNTKRLFGRVSNQFDSNVVRVASLSVSLSIVATFELNWNVDVIK